MDEEAFTAFCENTAEDGTITAVCAVYEVSKAAKVDKILETTVYGPTFLMVFLIPFSSLSKESRQVSIPSFSSPWYVQYIVQNVDTFIPEGYRSSFVKRVGKLNACSPLVRWPTLIERQRRSSQDQGSYVVVSSFFSYYTFWEVDGNRLSLSRRISFRTLSWLCFQKLLPNYSELFTRRARAQNYVCKYDWFFFCHWYSHARAGLGSVHRVRSSFSCKPDSPCFALVLFDRRT
jgi:hypothetical protein